MARWPSRSGSGLARSSASQTSLGKRKTIEAWTDASPRPSHAYGGIRRERAPAGRPPEGGLSESENYSKPHPRMPSFFWFWAHAGRPLGGVALFLIPPD